MIEMDHSDEAMSWLTDQSSEEQQKVSWSKESSSEHLSVESLSRPAQK